MPPQSPEPGEAAAKARPPTVSVVVPTYRERDNIGHLVERLAAVRDRNQLDLDLWLMDDNSQDGSEEKVRSLGLAWVHMVVRTKDRGLSQAVLEGIQKSANEVIVVMDADLSHPPEKIPDMLARLDRGFDFVVGSRFVDGGTTDDDWGLFRWLNSRVATLLAWPLTRLKDPMSGFFALRRTTVERGSAFNPVGYKIGLELVIKCRCNDVTEVPIHFADRRFGTSKLSFKEQLKYLQHIRRLYIYKYGNWSHFAQFLVVGLTGLVVNLAVLTVLLTLGMGKNPAVLLAIALSMVWNFVLNRRFSFSYARKQSMWRQFVGFVSASSLGAAVNYGTTLGAWNFFSHKQMAAVVGVLAGTGFNFLMSRFLVFRKEHVRPPTDEA